MNEPADLPCSLADSAAFAHALVSDELKLKYSHIQIYHCADKRDSGGGQSRTEELLTCCHILSQWLITADLIRLNGIQTFIPVDSKPNTRKASRFLVALSVLGSGPIRYVSLSEFINIQHKCYILKQLFKLNWIYNSQRVVCEWCSTIILGGLAWTKSWFIFSSVVQFVPNCLWGSCSCDSVYEICRQGQEVRLVFD